jgi:tRNA pseudouridine38-40 synthase
VGTVIHSLNQIIISFVAHFSIVPNRLYKSPPMPTQRYMLTIAYRGTRYHGWQFQLPNPLTWKGPWPKPGEGIPTIQEIMAKELGRVVGHPVILVGSSRTDSGVHAKGQVAHFDTHQTQIPIEGLRQAVNAQLPDDMLIRSIQPVPHSFNAIRSAARKRYQYLIWNAPERPVFIADLSWHRRKALDASAMSDAAQRLVGEHDFASFARPGHKRETTVRTILSCTVHQRGPRIVIGVEGTGFLWNMVRIIAGTLIDIGHGRYQPEEIETMLTARNRRAAGGTAPPQGLYLQWVKFQEGFNDPAEQDPSLEWSE